MAWGWSEKWRGVDGWDGPTWGMGGFLAEERVRSRKVVAVVDAIHIIG